MGWEDVIGVLWGQFSLQQLELLRFWPFAIQKHWHVNICQKSVFFFLNRSYSNFYGKEIWKTDFIPLKKKKKNGKGGLLSVICPESVEKSVIGNFICGLTHFEYRRQKAKYRPKKR